MIRVGSRQSLNTSMTKKPTPPYTLDKGTRTQVEALLNMMMTLADLQVSDQARNDIHTLCEDLAEKFGIEGHDLMVSSETHTNDNGDTTHTITTRPKHTKPRLSIVSNDDFKDWEPDPDDQAN